MPYAEYQKTVPPKFIIIIHNYANVWTIMQPIKITTQFSGSDATGRHYWFFDSEFSERVGDSKGRLKFRLLKMQSY